MGRGRVNIRTMPITHPPFTKRIAGKTYFLIQRLSYRHKEPANMDAKQRRVNKSVRVIKISNRYYLYEGS